MIPSYPFGYSCAKGGCTHGSRRNARLARVRDVSNLGVKTVVAESADQDVRYRRGGTRSRREEEQCYVVSIRKACFEGSLC